MFIGIGIAVFLLQVGVYALWQSYRKAAVRIQQRADSVATRARCTDGGRYIGGVDRPGAN
jgi:hypothetical protein